MAQLIVVPSTFTAFLDGQLTRLPVLLLRGTPDHFENICEDTAFGIARFGKLDTGSGFLNLRLAGCKSYHTAGINSLILLIRDVSHHGCPNAPFKLSVHTYLYIQYIYIYLYLCIYIYMHICIIPSPY